jgi:hypothetical protein
MLGGWRYVIIRGSNLSAASNTRLGIQLLDTSNSDDDSYGG